MAELWQAKLAPVTVILGAFGSGKTEVALNCALAAAAAGQSVTLIDLDTVTPAFRSRQSSEALARAGVRLVAPTGALACADLPAVPEGIHEVLTDEQRAVLIDAGGSPAGARAVSSLAGSISERADAACWVVVNPWRPATAAPEDIARTVFDLAGQARVGPAQVLANLHLPEEGDDASMFLSTGFDIVSRGAASAGCPVTMCSVRRGLAEQALAALPSGVSLVPLDLYMRPPWDYQDQVAGRAEHGQQGYV